MRRAKKLLSLALAAVVIVTASVNTVAYAAVKAEDDCTYERISGKYAITSIDEDGSYYKNKTSIYVPEKISNKTITRIGDGDGTVLNNGGSGRRIYLPDSINLIASYAFEKTGIERFTMENGVLEIGERAFADSSDLRSVVLADSITKMGLEAFAGCSSLQSVTLPANLTKIPDSAFEDCSELDGVTIGNAVTSIGDSAFAGCDSLEEITIPPNVTRIGYDAFEDFITIRGYAGSAAEKYAKEYDIDFVNLGNSYSAAVRLSVSSLSVAVGATNSFTVTNPTNGSYSVSSNSSAVSVTQSGSTITVRGVSAGSATLTVTSSGLASATVAVTVGSGGSSNSGVLSLDTSSYSFNVGNVYYPLARVNSSATPTCTSSNPNVVAVKFQADRSNRADLKGGYTNAYLYQIQGKSAGTATITITSGAYTASFPVTVSTSPNGSAFCNPSVNFGVYKGSYYDVQMTVTGTNNAPSFTVGNGKVFKTQYLGKNGNVYSYRVWAIGNKGEKTGLYTQMPGDSKVVLHCEGQIAYG